MKILFLEDDLDYAKELIKYLHSKGDIVQYISSPEYMSEAIQKFKPDLLVCDLYLPVIPVQSFLNYISKLDIPKVIISNTIDKKDETLCLSYNISDFLTKESEFAALHLRMKKALQSFNTVSPILYLNGKRCVLNTITQVVTNNDDIHIKLPKLEFEILYYLITNPDRVISADELKKFISTKSTITENYITVLIHRLRNKLVFSNIVSERGEGYMWKTM